ASPVVRQVVISYLTHNQAPTVALATPAAGEFWRGTKEVKWIGSDPDKDTLAYEVLYSSDNGKSWKRIGQRTQAPTKSETKPEEETRTATPSGHASAATPATNPALARFREDLASADLSEDDRQKALQQADELVKKLEAEDAEPTTSAATGS